MDLRQFQDRSQTQANLGAIPAPAQETSAFEAVAGAFGQLAPTIGSAASVGAKLKAQELTQQDLGTFTMKLANAQQASQTKKGFDLAKAQRKIFQETVAANPSLTEDYIKTFKSVTGIEPAGLTEEQKAYQKDLLDAQSKGFGDPNDPPEVQQQQLELYQDTQREAILMEHEAKKLAADTAAASQEVYKRTGKLVSNKVQSLNLQLDQIRQKIANGGSREEGERQWMKLKSEWAVELAGFGQFADDPTVKAQIKGISDMFTDGDRFIRGEATLNDSQKASDISLARQKASIAADPKNANIIATSNFFGNSPALNLPISQAALAILNEGPSDIRSVPGVEKETTKKTFENMGKSEDPATRTEVATHITDISKHMGRNGEDYSDDELLEVCSVMAVPSAFESMDAGQKETVVQACNTYAVDVAQKAIRDIEQNSSIRIANEQVTPRGTTVFGEPTVLAAENFASLEVDANGFRYVAAPQFQNNRQVQRQIQSMNRNLAKVNPVMSILSSATGKSMETVAGETFGLGPMAVQPELVEQPITIADRLTQWYEENFVAPTEVATPEQREAQARQLGQSLMDMFTASPEEHLANITGQAPQQGEGTVLATEQPTGAPVSAPTGSPVDAVVSNILGVEGVGDEVTDVPTGAAGVTPAALAATGRSGVDPTTLSTEEALQVAREYTTKLDEGFRTSLPGYENLSPEAQEAILDTGYNLGPGVSRFPSFKRAVAAGDEQEAMKQLLDTANADGKSLRGIAKRRAHNYNLVADVPITTIEQLEDGTLRYLDANDGVVFSYKPRGGRHEDSGVGRISVN